MKVVQTEDSHFMRQAIRLAKMAEGRTSPNPLVGAVVVRDGVIVGRGHHKKAGTPHAEVHALNEAGTAARGATLYVTLEPCNHTGRTPPCTETVLAAGVKRVVVGMTDPNPHVHGSGAKFLRDHGVLVEEGLLEEECRAINRPFIKHVTTGIPWVILKAAVSIDGKLATCSGKSCWITGPEARVVVHRLRNRVDAIMVGSGTAQADDPSLTTRLSSGRKGRDPLRVVVDRNLRLKGEARMLRQQSTAGTIVFCGKDAPEARREKLTRSGARLIEVGCGGDGQLSLDDILAELGRMQITSLLVEGGGRLHSSFITQGLADEAYFFHAPLLLGNDGLALLQGFGADTVQDGVRLQRISYRRYGEDMLLHGFFPNQSMRSD